MALIPIEVAESDTKTYLKKFAIDPFHVGKVRNSYEYPGRYDLRIVEATDRLSIFDFVLNARVPFKGEVLTALTHFWLTGILKKIPNHLAYSSMHPNQSMIHDLIELFPKISARNCLVVKNIEIPPFESIFRYYIGGSVYKDYQKTGMAGGNRLPINLPKWTKLDEPIFTPSTKGAKDINITVAEYIKDLGLRGEKSIEMFKSAYKKAFRYAFRRGIIILDAKFEGLDEIGDELLTPDCSRFVTINDYNLAMEEGRDPVFYDKEVVREWGKKVITPFSDSDGNQIIGINNLDPENKQHVDFVHRVTVPEEIISETTERYHKIFVMLTGFELKEYQQKFMGI